MQSHFTSEIESLKTNLIKMASLVDELVDNAITGLATGNVGLCKGMKSRDREIDAYDNLIQVQCENILAIFQPFATDLRFVMSVLMINNQLERCGDIAVNIGQRAKKTSSYKELIDESKVIDMANRARKMVQSAIDSFIQNDIQLAKQVLVSDDEVDKLNKEIFNFLVNKMKSDSTLIEPCSHLIILIKHIERLADHATNICENLIFYIEAKVVSHPKISGKESSTND
ncbi:MAG: phosphate signaling complex protein PhoU [Ignavibacteria bacterium]|nr:phosphate signaling complex protein PhoU [Ignavibacteria bacterium]